jgi:peptide-methionine (R)-S-oxide reductase
MKHFAFVFLLVVVVSCTQTRVQKPIANSNVEIDSNSQLEIAAIEQFNAKKDSIKDFNSLTETEWKEILTDQEYYILREKGTERAFTGDLLNNKRKGTYVCSGCSTPLYKSETKFKSGTGWPSFYDIIDGNVLSVKDNSYGMQRTEVVCATCKGHQGHVFSDGPQPTGLRYCINSVSIKFIEE